MRSAIHSILFATLGLTSAWVLAAEPPAPVTQPPSAAADDVKKEPEAKQPAAEDAAAEGEQESAADKKSGEKGSKASPQRFIPSEQVRADFDVSFPVDI
jgi:hypothetical protein